jgi:hypothetical protein
VQTVRDRADEERAMWDMFRGRGSAGPESIGAVEDAGQLAETSPRLVDAAAGQSWYTRPGNPVDAAVASLCRLRRAASADRKRSEGGDEAVRAALEQADHDAVVWLASRVVSYMDEQGYPEHVEPWLVNEASGE